MLIYFNIWKSLLMCTISCLQKALIHRPHSFEDCVVWARTHWENQYANQIKQLLYNFPPDKDTTSGQPFWSGPKRCPSPLDFDTDEDMHLDYVIAAANLQAQVYGIPGSRDRKYVARLISATNVSNLLICKWFNFSFPGQHKFS